MDMDLDLGQERSDQGRVHAPLAAPRNSRDDMDLDLAEVDNYQQAHKHEMLNSLKMAARTRKGEADDEDDVHFM
jgi:hypothetical protein